MQVSGYKAAFTLMSLSFLELDTHYCHLDFNFLDENNNVINQTKFNLQLLNKNYEYM